MKKIAILGSTGSIGTQTLDVIRKNNDLAIVQQLQFSDLLNFIELPNFQITMDLVPVIMDKICEQESILPRPEFKIFVMERLVLRREKASNPKEYRRLSHVLTELPKRLIVSMRLEG